MQSLKLKDPAGTRTQWCATGSSQRSPRLSRLHGASSRLVSLGSTEGSNAEALLGSKRVEFGTSQFEARLLQTILVTYCLIKRCQNQDLLALGQLLLLGKSARCSEHDRML